MTGNNSRTHSNYEWAIPHLIYDIDPNSVILDVGAFDLKDSIFFVNRFNCAVIAFEADPANLQTCLEEYSKQDFQIRKKIKIDSRFLGSETSEIDFYQVNQIKYSNSQASSKYKLDFSDRTQDDPDFGLEDIQDRVKVNSIRYSNTNYPTPHTIFMDVQGSELEVLLGMGAQISDVKNIVFESSIKRSYLEASNYFDIDKFLTEEGFQFQQSSYHGSKKPRRGLFARRFDFDVVYSRSR